MKQISVERAFQWAQAIAVREWRLMLPVAFAFFGLPGLLVDVFMPTAMRALMPSAPLDAAAQGQALAALVAMLAVDMIGALAITALALVPGISVAEAIGRALRRLPALGGALIMVAAAVLVGALAVATLLSTAHAQAAAMQATLMLLIFAAGALLWVRFCLVTPILVERGTGPAPALQLSWRLSAGLFWRLFAALLAYFVGGTLLLLALSSAVGAMVTLGARAMGAGEIGLLIAAILFRALGAAVNAGFQLVIASLYRQLE